MRTAIEEHDPRAAGGHDPAPAEAVTTGFLVGLDARQEGLRGAFVRAECEARRSAPRQSKRPRGELLQPRAEAPQGGLGALRGGLEVVPEPRADLAEGA